LHSQYPNGYRVDKGRLAQLVQSTSFTPRGSGVRTPHRPQKTSTEMLKFFLFYQFIIIYTKPFLAILKNYKIKKKKIKLNLII
jgi:hypothetical protein